MANLIENWEEIKTEYITTDISQRALAKKYGVSASQIARHSKAESWVDERERHKSKTLAKTLDKVSTKEAGRLARLIDATNNAVEVAVKAFEDEQQLNRYLVTRKEVYSSPVLDDDGKTFITEKQWTEERTFSKVDTKALKDLTAVLKDLTGLMRDFYNIPTPAQEESQRIAAERLELDKRKVDADADADVNINVFLDGELDDWSN